MKTCSLILSIFFFLFLSCESKPEKKQTEMKTVVREAETIYSSSSDQEWQTLEVQFDQLESEYEKERSSYSQAQIDSINLQIGRFRAIQAKRVAAGLKQDIEDLGKQAEGFIDELSK